MERTNPKLRVMLSILGGVLLVSMQAAMESSALAQADDAPDTARVGQIEIRVESTGAVTSRSLAAELETTLLDMQETISVVVGQRPDAPLQIRFVGSADRPVDNGWTAVAPETWVNDDATVAIIDLDAWLALSESEATNRFRHLIARRWLVGVSEGSLPSALLDGFARYLETPVLAQQARGASMVQQAYLDGDLPGWSDMVDMTGAQHAEQDESVASQHIALAAFLVERYGAGILRDLAARYANDPAGDPTAAIVEATGQTPDRLDQSWEEFLATWFAGGWRSNVFSAMDLGPAEALFARGAYEAAVDRANQTLMLTTALDDRIGSAEAERVAAQGSVGMQAEALMADAEEALRDHDYGRALVLIDRAEDQYELLPEDHQPASLVESWRGLATDGADALSQLEEARGESADWFLMHGAREEAIEAGSTFASLGDAERVTAAERLVDELDARLFRLVLALGGATVILVSWLLVWGWHRAPGRVDWPSTLAKPEREATA